jgi:hypothetical protein
MVLFTNLKTKKLLPDIPATTFTNETATTTLEISTTSVYRFYNGTVTPSTICETIAPATPVVTEQWTTKGQIVITTTPIKVANTTPNSTKITGYNHNSSKNITFCQK